LTRVGKKPADTCKFQLLHCIKPITVRLKLRNAHGAPQKVSITRVLLRDLDARIDEILSSAHKAFGTKDARSRTSFQLKCCILKRLDLRCGQSTVKVQRIIPPSLGYYCLQLSQ
jgi:hypothetical protein